jgi:hypothetical protein
MTTKAALLALLALWGIGGAAALPAMAQERAPIAEESAEGTPLKRSLANRVWVKTDSDDLPSVIRIFLSDGTLVSDSCWETHRLSSWHMTSDRSLSWSEDGIDIAAEIVSVSADALVLRLDLSGGAVEERYTAATVPYVCPDIPA